MFVSYFQIIFILKKKEINNLCCLYMQDFLWFVWYIKFVLMKYVYVVVIYFLGNIINFQELLKFYIVLGNISIFFYFVNFDLNYRYKKGVIRVCVFYYFGDFGNFILI